MQAPEETVVEQPATWDEPTEGATAASRFDYDAMLQEETKGKQPEKSQPKRGADGHLTFDTDGALPLPWCGVCVKDRFQHTE